MRRVIAFCVFLCSALQATTALEEAERLFSLFSQEISKSPPPKSSSDGHQWLDSTSVWLSIDATSLAQQSGLEEEGFWSACKEIGFDGIYFQRLKEQDGFHLDPNIQISWPSIQQETRKRSITLIGSGVQSTLGWGPDFSLALQNVDPYPSLFHMVEIAPTDWALLPEVPPGAKSANIPWMELQALHKKGYVPEAFHPYTKQSAWNASPLCPSPDGKLRRWIYLKQGEDLPVLSWLQPTFAAARLSAGAVLQSLFELGQKGVTIEGKLPLFAKNTLALWIRKMGGFSVEKSDAGWHAWENLSTDFLIDSCSPAPLLHALLTEDAEALRLLYLLFLQNEIPLSRLVHQLAPFDRFVSDWSQWLSHPKQKILYSQEQLTAEALIQRLLKQDLYCLGKTSSSPFPFSTWAGYCSAGGEKWEASHLLLSFFYLMQPGIFSLSASDLLGLTKQEKIHLWEKNEGALYASLPIQLSAPNSFANRLRNFIDIRNRAKIGKGALLNVPCVQNKSSCLLFYKVQGGYLLSAVNFGSMEVSEEIEEIVLRNTMAIELQSGRQEKKGFSSSTFSFSIPPRCGKLFFFQRRGN